MRLAKPLFELLTLNWRNAFALFATGISVLALRAAGRLGDAIDLWFGSVAIFAFWILVGLAIGKLDRAARIMVRARRIKRRHDAIDAEREQTVLRQRDEEARADEAFQAELARISQEARDRALSNLKQLESLEMNSLRWIYHRHNGRARAYINDKTIRGLCNLGLLSPQDSGDRASTHRTIVIPDFVMEELKRVFGPREPSYGNSTPPWMSADRK